MPYITVQRFRQMHKGKPQELFLAAVPAEEVSRRKKIDVQSPENPGGYQRRLDSGRVRAISTYILSAEGMLPTALLVNIRVGAWFEPLDGSGDFGKLHFDEDQPWWIEDGQHRSGGVDEAVRVRAEKALTQKRDKPERLSYDLPVVFCLNFGRADEMDLFNIVNSKAKSVPTDLVASIIFNRVTEERGKDEPGKVSVVHLRKAAGVAIGRYLADRSPWKGHIQETNESKDAVNKPMQANTFASTLLPVMRERYVHTRFLTNPEDPDWQELAKVVQEYWEVLADLMPEAFADIAHYSVQRPVGVYAFHELLPEIIDVCRMEGDWSKEFVKAKLGLLEDWVSSAQWHRETGADIIKGSGNRAAIRVVVDRMRVLYHAPLTGLGD